MRQDYFDLKEFERLQQVQVTIVLFLLHANIEREFDFLVTKGNLTLLFFGFFLIQLELTHRPHLFPRDAC